MTVTKVCRRCQEEKPTTEYYKNKYNKDRLQSYCKTCNGQVTKDWMREVDYHKSIVLKRDPLHNKKRHLKRRYGMTIEDYDRMCAEQNNKCKICDEERELVVDHCHTQGHVRGLLCHGCNNALHHFDNEKLFNKALLYIGKNI